MKSNRLQTMPLRFRVWDKAQGRFILENADLDEYASMWREAGVGGEGEIVSQDTGLVDKNSNNIFTGDIVKCWDGEFGKVYYDTILLQIRVRFEDDDDEGLASCEPEVVGNIWQNPELFGGRYAQA